MNERMIFYLHLYESGHYKTNQYFVLFNYTVYTEYFFMKEGQCHLAIECPPPTAHKNFLKLDLFYKEV